MLNHGFGAIMALSNKLTISCYNNSIETAGNRSHDLLSRSAVISQLSQPPPVPH